MARADIFSAAFATLKDTDTVGEATRRMLADRVSDLPVVDAAGKFVGMFKLERLFEVVLPKAARLDFGMPDLAFVSDTIGQLRERMHAIEGDPVRAHVVAPQNVVRPDTSPAEIVMLLYKGANAVPVVAPEDGRLVGLVTARDVLAALQPNGGR